MAVPDEDEPAGGTPAGKNGAHSLREALGKSPVRSTMRSGDAIFRQGEPAEAMYYIQRGSIRLSTVSPDGKEGVIAFLGPGDLVGECAIARVPRYVTTATVLEDAELLRVDREAMIGAIRERPEVAESVVRYLLTQNTRITEDLTDLLFLSAEKRLARLLLSLAGLERGSAEAETEIRKISDETLAAKIGTTRSRVNQFMNRFRKLGLIDYAGNRMTVRRALVEVILDE